MPRFFVNSTAVRDGVVRIEGDDAAHLARSLRVRKGERIVVVESGRLMHEVAVTHVSPTAVLARVQQTRDASGESHLAVHVLQAVPARGMDDAIEALTIAGARAIHPIVTERGVARPAADAGVRRAIRWQAIAREAAQLAGRAVPPAISPLRPLDEALTTLPAGCRILACVATPDATPISAINTGEDDAVACVIGPEGGLGREDLSALQAAGPRQRRVHLGERIVPSRLAGFMAVTLILGARGELASPPADFPATARVAS